jgi:hypothetical protein
MEEWIDFDEVFFRHSSEAQDQQEHQDHEHGHEQSQGRALGRRMIMSIFQVKCALIALFGEEVPTVSNVSTYTSSSAYVLCCVVLS